MATFDPRRQLVNTVKSAKREVKRNVNGGARNTTAPTVQQQAQQQSVNQQNKERQNKERQITTTTQTQRTNKQPEIKSSVNMSNYDAILDAADRYSSIPQPLRKMFMGSVGANAVDNPKKATSGSVGNNVGTLWNGIKSIPGEIKKYGETRKRNEALGFGMTDEQQEEIARSWGASEDDIALAKQAHAARIDYMNRNAQGGLHTYEDMVRNQKRTAGGLPSDSWLAYLPDDDGNILDRTANATRAGILQHGQGFTGLQAKIGETLGADEYEQDRLKDYEYQQLLNQQALSGDNQGMYDRIVSNAVSNTLTGLETMALGELGGLDVGTKALENVGLGNMGVNAFGNAYGQVRTGALGEQYRNDTDAATRYALGSALNEIAQEKMFDALGLISGGKITESTIPGASVFGLGSFMTEAAEEGAGALADPLSEALLEGDFMSEDYRRRVGEIYREQGLRGTLQNAGNAALEGGLGGVAGGVMSNPYQAVRQVGTDINAIRADLGAEGIKNTLKAYDQAMQEGQEPSGFVPNPNGYSFEGARALQMTPEEIDKRRRQMNTDEAVRDSEWEYDEALGQAENNLSKRNDAIRRGNREGVYRNGKALEKNISTLRNLVSRGGLRSSIPSIRERARRANEAVIRYDAAALDVIDYFGDDENGKPIFDKMSEEQLQNIIGLSNELGIPVDFLPGDVVENNHAGAWFEPGGGGERSLVKGIIHLPNRPVIFKTSIYESLLHEITHPTEGTHAYEKLKNDYKDNRDVRIDKDGNITNKKRGTTRYAEDVRHMFGTETIANRNANFGMKNPGSVKSMAQGKNLWIQMLFNAVDPNGNRTNFKTRAKIATTTERALEAIRAAKYARNDQMLLYDPHFSTQLERLVDDMENEAVQKLTEKLGRKPTFREVDDAIKKEIVAGTGMSVEDAWRYMSHVPMGLNPDDPHLQYNGDIEFRTPKETDYGEVRSETPPAKDIPWFTDYSTGKQHYMDEESPIVDAETDINPDLMIEYPEDYLNTKINGKRYMAPGYTFKQDLAKTGLTEKDVEEFSNNVADVMNDDFNTPITKEVFDKVAETNAKAKEIGFKTFKRMVDNYDGRYEELKSNANNAVDEDETTDTEKAKLESFLNEYNDEYKEIGSFIAQAGVTKSYADKLAKDLEKKGDYSPSWLERGINSMANKTGISKEEAAKKLEDIKNEYNKRHPQGLENAQAKAEKQAEKAKKAQEKPEKKESVSLNRMVNEEARAEAQRQKNIKMSKEGGWRLAKNGVDLVKTDKNGKIIEIKRREQKQPKSDQDVFNNVVMGEKTEAKQAPKETWESKWNEMKKDYNRVKDSLKQTLDAEWNWMANTAYSNVKTTKQDVSRFKYDIGVLASEVSRDVNGDNDVDIEGLVAKWNENHPKNKIKIKVTDENIVVNGETYPFESFVYNNYLQEKDSASAQKTEEKQVEEVKVEEPKAEEVKKENPVEEKREEERKEETPKEETAKVEAPVEPTQQEEKTEEKPVKKAKEDVLSEETRQDLETLAYFRNQEIENAKLPSGMERVQRKSDEETNPKKERVQTKYHISKADTEVASMDTHEMMKYFRQEEWEGSEEYSKKTNEEKDAIDNELDTLVEEVENPKDISREEGEVYNTLAAILYRAGGKLEHVNSLAKTYEETGKIKGRRDIERDILNAHKNVDGEKFKDSASAQEFVQRVVRAWKNSTQASQEMSQKAFTRETGLEVVKNPKTGEYELAKPSKEPAKSTIPVDEKTDWKVVDSPDSTLEQARKEHQKQVAESAKNIAKEAEEKIKKETKKEKLSKEEQAELNAAASVQAAVEQKKNAEDAAVKEEIKKDQEKTEQTSEEFVKGQKGFRKKSDKFNTSQTVEKWVDEGKDFFTKDILKGMERLKGKGKEIQSQKGVRLSANEILEHYGIDGLLKKVEEAQKGGVVLIGETQTALGYAAQAACDLSRKAEVQMGRFEKTAEANGYSITNKGFEKNGETLKEITIDGKTYSFESYKDCKQANKHYMQKAIDALTYADLNIRESARNTNMTKLLHEIPEYQPVRIRREVAKLNNEFKKALKGNKIVANEKLLEDYILAENDEDRAKIMAEIEYDLAKQIPGDIKQYADAIRRIAMLCNIRTFVRNDVSNKMHSIKFDAWDNPFQIYLEKFANKHGYSEENNRAAFVGGKNNPYRKYAASIRESSRYTEHAQDDVKFNRNRMLELRGAFGISDNKGVQFLNKLHSGTMNVLENGFAVDIGGKKVQLLGGDQQAIDKRADIYLARALKAQKYELREDNDGNVVAGKEVMKDGKKTFVEITSDQLEEYKREALLIAKEATYHDNNAFAKKFNEWKKTPLIGWMLDARIPFVGSPFNIAKRAFEASPAGALYAIHEMKTKVESGEMPAPVAFAHFTRGISGTVAMLIGMALARSGLISTPDDDDDAKTEYYKENIFGKANYALHLGDKYYSIDWAFPVTAPILWGASIESMWEKYVTDETPLFGEDDNIIEDAIYTMAPLLRATYFENLNSILEEASQGYAYGGLITSGGTPGSIDRIVTGTAENYIKQFFPTAGAAFNRTIDETKRTTSGKNPAERVWNSFKASAPFGSYFLEPAIDEKGNTMKGIGTIEGKPLLSLANRATYNFGFPATITQDTHDAHDETLVKDHGAPMSQNLLKKALGDDYKEISAKQYTEVKKAYYKNYNNYTKEFTSNPSYNNLGDYTKQQVYESLSQQAFKDAKATYFDGMGDTKELYTTKQVAAQHMNDLGVNPAEFYTLTQDTGLTAKQQAIYVANQYEQAGILQKVIQGVKDGYYDYDDVGLTKTVAEMEEEDRLESELGMVDAYGKTLEQMVAEGQAVSTKKEHDAIVDLREQERNEVAQAIEEEKTGVSKLLKDRAVATGMTEDQYRSYEKIEGLKRETGGTISYTQQLQVAEAMMKDGTWENYVKAYQDGKLNQDDLAKIHLNKTFLNWTDDAINSAVKLMNEGKWVDADEFKKWYKKTTGRSATGRLKTSGSGGGSSYGYRRTSSHRGSGSRSSGTSSSDILAEDMKLYQKFLTQAGKALSKKGDLPSASVNLNFQDDSALWDKLMSGNKSSVEKLRKELGIK